MNPTTTTQPKSSTDVGPYGRPGEHYDQPEKHMEGPVARSIEQQTAKVPSDIYLWAAGASMIGSLVLQLMGRKADSQFVGMWAPSFLLLGVYNKIVKVAGSDRITRDYT